MNSWLSYLKYKIYEDVNTVFQLLLIDNKIQGTKYDINYLVNFINENLTTMSFFFINDSSFLIEGNPLSLIKVINDNLNDNGERVVVLENNVAINKWIISVYEDYVKEYVQQLNDFSKDIENFVDVLKKEFADKKVVLLCYEKDGFCGHAAQIYFL